MSKSGIFNAAVIVLLSCMVVKVHAEEQGAADVLKPQSGKTLGGPLREGPGTQYPSVYYHPVPFRYDVKIMRNTHVRLGAFDWFEVLFEEDKLYMFGGNLCTDNSYIQGTAGKCSVIQKRQREESLQYQR